MTDHLARAVRVARGQEPADLVVCGARVVDVLTQQIRPADVAIAGDRIVAVAPGLAGGRRDDRGRRTLRRSGLHRRARPHRELDGRAGALRRRGPAARHDDGRQRSARDRQRARRRRRALDARRERGPRPVGADDGPGLRAGLAAGDRGRAAGGERPDGLGRASARAGPGRDDELPGRARRRPGRAGEVDGLLGAADRRPRARRARRRPAGLPRRGRRLRPRVPDRRRGAREGRGRHDGVLARGDQRAQPARRPACGDARERSPLRVLHRRSRAGRAARRRLDRRAGADGDRCRARSAARADAGDAQPRRALRAARPWRDRAGAPRRPGALRGSRRRAALAGDRGRPGRGARRRAHRRRRRPRPSGAAADDGRRVARRPPAASRRRSRPRASG